MLIRIPFLTLFVLLFAFSASAQTRSVAITIDDLPGTHGDSQHYLNVNDRLLSTLVEYQVPAVGFVNESKLYSDHEPNPELVQILDDWMEAGMNLGNHTYSHVFINQTPLDEYKMEVLKGEKITKEVMNEYGKKLTYFRHTQLRTGPTEEYRVKLNAFLTDQGYTVAPVTIDNDEYIYAYCYFRAHENGDEVTKEWIRNSYLKYMEEVFSYYERLSKYFLGYEPPQILLLHVNLLNADTLPVLLEMLKARGYRFVELEESLSDPAYELPVVQADRGLSWLHRWMLAEGIRPEPQPGVSEDIQNLFDRYQREEE